ncbi:MAG: radical SAM protein [Myxococcales bacterium]|nr:radical SAM protein [Myxococcales bacterium]
MAGPITALARRASLALRLAETWVHRPRTPTRLVLDITRRCNLRCAMCRTWEAPSAGELTAAEILGIIDQLPGLCWLDVTGGEPFLRADAGELLRAIAVRGRALQVLHFPTNGWFSARTIAATRGILEARDDLEVIVTVSVDGPPALHDRIRGRAGAFDRAIATFRGLRALTEDPRLKVYVGTTISADNHEHLDALEAALAAAIPGFGGRAWHYNWLQVSGHFFNNQGVAAPPPPERLVHRHLGRRGIPRDLVDLMELVFLVNREFYNRGEAAGVPCQALRSAAFVSPEGDLYPCHVYDRPLGSLRERTFAELWADPATLEARADIERLACGGCFTPCEAYPALAGAPVATLRQTSRRLLTLAGEAIGQR